MKKIIGVVLLCGVLFSSCLFSGNIVEEERTVEAFTGIKSCCGIDVYIAEGNSSTIRVEADDAIIDNIVTEVTDSVLNISYRNDTNEKFSWGMKKMSVYVTAQDLTLIDASSASDVRSEGELNAKDIEINANSAADIFLELEAENVTCRANSGSDITLIGTASSANISAASGANIRMKEMIVNKAVVDASSGSDVDIWVKEEIEANASSGSDINYYGNPPHAKVSPSSGADIRKK